MNTTSLVGGERLANACSSFWTSGSQRSGDFFAGADFSSRGAAASARQSVRGIASSWKARK